MDGFDNPRNAWGRRGQQSFASVAGGGQGGRYDRNRDQNREDGGRYQDGGYGGGRRGGYREPQREQREPLGINDDTELPEQVRSYLHDIKTAIERRDTVAMQQLYEAEFKNLSEIFYANKAWPDPKVVEVVVGDTEDRIFSLLYRELYYRHIYENSREGPTLQQRVDSYSNYVHIFDLILNRDAPLDIGLPNEWLWDMIDEFMYQFTQFCSFRAKADKLDREDAMSLREEPMTWNVTVVTNIWLRLVQTSRIQEQLAIFNAGGDIATITENDAFAEHSMYKMLGLYSLISLMRLNCLLGDYYSALKVLDNMELGKKHLHQSGGLQACLVATYYHVGVCYMMMRRYEDAIRTFCDLLLYQQRAITPAVSRGAAVGGPAAGGRTYQVDSLGKTIDKMYNCLGICLILHPMHIDESITSSLRDKLGDRMNRIQKNADEEDFEKLLNQGLPKFIIPVTNLEDIQPNSLKEFQHYQIQILAKEFAAQKMVHNIQSYLKLYSSMPIDKLARFLDMKDDVLLQHLYTYKHKMTNIVHTHGSPLNGTLVCRPELDFYIDKDMVYIADTKVAPRFGEFFVRNIQKFEELTQTLKQINVGNKEPRETYT